MNMSEKIKCEVLNKFEEGLKNSEYKLVRDVSFPDFYNFKTRVDGLIKTDDDHPYCVIFVRMSLKGLRFKFIKAEVLRVTKKTGIKLAIITNGTSFYFSNSMKYDFEKKDYDTLIEKLLYVKKKEHIKRICEYLNKNFNSLSVSEDNIYFDDNKYTLKKEIERDLVNEVFQWKNVYEHIYRYTSLNTAFEILKKGRIKLFGIAGMNDASEPNYIEEILYQSGIQTSNAEKNKIFIMSCSIGKEDDLTQWRLYGDDAKGACLTFRTVRKKGGFVVRKIKYIGQNSKPIQKLIKLIKYVEDLTEYMLVFNTIHEWCHFIKPKDYEVESEVRLLYQLSDNDKTDGWVLSNGTNIINPYIEIDLLNEDFPLKLIDIKLGPKCPERETNRFQLEEFIKDSSKLKGISISESDIKNYR